MPSKSKAQDRLMKAVSASPKFSKETGIPQSVGREYAKADERKGAYPPKSNTPTSGGYKGPNHGKR